MTALGGRMAFILKYKVSCYFVPLYNFFNLKIAISFIATGVDIFYVYLPLFPGGSDSKESACNAGNLG